MRLKKITKKLVVSVLWLSACCTLSSAPSFAEEANHADKPNVLLIYTDDHRYSGVHALGGQAVSTPNLDALAHDGFMFTHTFLQGAFTGATCIASRAMLHTGRNVFKLQGIGFGIPKPHTTIGESFMQAGYYSYHVGKWHNDMNSLARSFHSGARVSGKPVYLTDQYRMPYSDWQSDGKYKKEDTYLLEYGEGKQAHRRPLTKNDKKGPTGDESFGPHVTQVLADAAVDFVQSYDKQQPFFLHLAFPTPHDPRQADKKYKAMYPEQEMVLPPSYLPQHPFDNGHMVIRDEKLDVWPRSEAIARKHLSDYYAIISQTDAQIGRVIQQLKDSGLYDNTIIVMAGDSGLAVGNHGLLGKQNVYDEDGLHIPLIISGKIKGNGKRIAALSYVHDIFPTIADLAGIKTPKSITGKSLKHIMMGEQQQVRDYTYHAYRQHQRAYRKGDFKLIEFVKAPDRQGKKGPMVNTGSRVTLLFNIKDDPWETTNLAFLPQYKQTLKKMKNEMVQKSKDLADNKQQLKREFDFWDYYALK